MDFKSFLDEQTQKHAVLAFGRMNPPTTGHAKLVDKVKEVAKEVGGTHHVVLSHTQDPKKNPLSGEDKVKHAKRYFPDTNITSSDKAHPNFLSQASKLHKAGATHIHMVAGSDRTGEYEKLLHKYNGVKGEHGYFKFKGIHVHSAGERDPDSEGVEGMSASKMREHASKGNFKEFKKGIPAHVKSEHAKELYNDVRKGMNVKEDFDSIVSTILSEGVHDKGIFKAVFLSGGPGSGKDYILDNTLAGHGLVEINSDKALEFLMDKNNLDKKMPESEKEVRNIIRGKAKDMTELKQHLALLGRNGLIINGTGDDPAKYAKIKNNLESIGYETMMVSVNTKDEVSSQRNVDRGKRGGRTVPEDIRKEKWDAVNNSRPEMAKLFGHNFLEIDNSEDLRSAKPEIVKAKKDEMLNIFKKVQEFVKKVPKNPDSEQWVAGELSKKDTLPIDKKGAENAGPAPDDAAQTEASKLGLQYYGFGRYGKNGKVTHHSVHGKLVQDPTHAEQQKVAAKAAKIKPNLSSGSPVSKKVSESIDEEFEKLINEVTDKGVHNGNYDGPKTAKGPEGHTYTATAGKPRVYVIRNSAAKDAHRMNGEIIKTEKGYMVKLKENEHVEIYKELSEQKTLSISTSGDTGANQDTGAGVSGSATSGDTYTCTRASGRNTISEDAGCGCAACQATSGRYDTSTKEKKKLYLSQTKSKLAKKVKESIDQGIETGMSMAAGGESGSRDMGEKLSKKGKAIPFTKDSLKEMGGDETTASIGDQKEDELKKQGISLTTFKKRNFT